jgi:hypothetical protein
MDVDNINTIELGRDRLEHTQTLLASHEGRAKIADIVRGMVSQRRSRAAVARRFGLESIRTKDELGILRDVYAAAEHSDLFSTPDPRDLTDDTAAFFIMAYWLSKPAMCTLINERAVLLASFRTFGPHAVWPATMLEVARRTESALLEEYVDRNGLYATDPRPTDIALLEGLVLIFSACEMVKVLLGRAQREYASWGCIMLLYNANITSSRGALLAMNDMEAWPPSGRISPAHYAIIREYRVSFSSGVFGHKPTQAVRGALMKIVHARKMCASGMGCGSLAWEASDEEIQNYIASLATRVSRMGDPGWDTEVGEVLPVDFDVFN